MKVIENKSFGKERALYGMKDLKLHRVHIDGIEDGESALKECQNILVDDCYFNLRYPFWHDDKLTIQRSEMTENCRAALWYSHDIMIKDSKLHCIKALRECKNVTIDHCDIISPEFGWSTENIFMNKTTAISEYFMLRAKNLNFRKVNFQGKYSFQYIQNANFEKCDFNTKDAFWHSDNVTVKDSVIKGEYLAWYSNNLTLIRCKIIGTQPFCYCKNLNLIDCEMIDTDLAFERSEVNATILSKVQSIKNPYKGTIRVQDLDSLLYDDENAKGLVYIEKQKGL